MSTTPTYLNFNISERNGNETHSIAIDRASTPEGAHSKAKAEANAFIQSQGYQSHLRTISMEQESALSKTPSSKQGRKQEKRMLHQHLAQTGLKEESSHKIEGKDNQNQSTTLPVPEENSRKNPVAPSFYINVQIGQFSRTEEDQYQTRSGRVLSFSDSTFTSKSQNGSVSGCGSEEEDCDESSSDIGSNQSLLHEDDDDKSSRMDSDDHDDVDFEEKIRWLFVSTEDEEGNSTTSDKNMDLDDKEKFGSFEQELHTSTNENSEELSHVIGKRVKVQDERNKYQQVEEEPVVFPQFQHFHVHEKKRDAKLRRKTQRGSPLCHEIQGTILDDISIQPFLTPDLTKPNKSGVKKNTEEQKATLFEKAGNLAQLFNGESLSNTFSICKGKNALKFKCANNHTFFLGVNLLDTLSFKDLETAKKSVAGAAISSDFWCYKCTKFYEQCKEVAAQVGVVVVSTPFQNKITLTCEKRGHTFDITYSKKLQTLCCGDCKKQERDEMKERLRVEEEQRNEDYQKKQKELFEKARVEMEQQRRSSPDVSSSSSSWSNKAKMSYYQTMEEKINLKAKQQAVEYLRGQQGGNVSQEKTFLVYKFVNTPIDFIIAGMGQMMREQCQQYFRKLALQLHPDKNQHPLAKEAFQRLQEAQSAVCGVASKAAC